MEGCIDVIRVKLHAAPNPFASEQAFMDLVQIQLRNNDFIFNQQYCQQTKGNAMDWAPALAAVAG